MFDNETIQRYKKGGTISVAQAAAKLECHHNTVLNMIEAGVFIPYRPGKKKYRLYKIQVAEYKARKEHEAIQEAMRRRHQGVFDFYWDTPANG